MGGKPSSPAQATPTGGSSSNSSLDDSRGINSKKKARPQHEFLTDEEQAVTQRTWSQLQSGEVQAMGVTIFLRIFELAPETKKTFPAFRNLSKEELVTNVMFRSHATRFMKAVEVTMNNLDALDVIIIPNLKQLGRVHTGINGFKVEYLDVFEVAMEEVWTAELGKQFDDATRKAWKKIFHLITSKVMEGYEDASSSCCSRKGSTLISDAAAAASAAPVAAAVAGNGCAGITEIDGRPPCATTTTTSAADNTTCTNHIQKFPAKTIMQNNVKASAAASSSFSSTSPSSCPASAGAAAAAAQVAVTVDTGCNHRQSDG